jgi:hypothetical protein
MTQALTFEPLENKYTRAYFSIIRNRQANPVTGYTENHHIHPECLGGSNEKTNKVKLSAREHYLCHLLLTKMLLGEPKKRMHYAFYSMRRKKDSMERYEPNSHIYEIVRKKIDRKPSAETRARMSASQKKRAARTPETCKKLSKSISASYTTELRALRSAQFTGRIISDKTRHRQSISRTGMVRSEESKLKQSASISGANHWAAKTWTLLSPEGEVIKTSAMNDFCIERGLNYYSLRNRANFGDQRPISRGPSKDWSVLGYS